jgi:hypothetical protein
MKTLFFELNKFQNLLDTDGFVYGLFLGSLVSLSTLAILHIFFADRKDKNK